MVLAHLRQAIKCDLFRYRGATSTWDFIKAFWTFPGFRYSYYQRHCYYFQNQNTLNFKTRFHFYNFFKTWLDRKYGFQVHFRCKFGNGVFFEDHGSIVIGEGVIFGQNINLNPRLKVGIEEHNQEKDMPKFGNNIWIGTNVVITKGVLVGNNVVIESGALVDFNIPDNSLVKGNPTSLCTLDDISGYIKNPISIKPRKRN